MSRGLWSSVKTLDRHGKCIHCGKLIEAKVEEVYRFHSSLSQQGGVSLCKECVKEIYRQAITVKDNLMDIRESLDEEE